MPPFGPGPRAFNNISGQKTDFKSIKKLIVFCKSHILSIIIAVLLAMASAITTIVGPEKISDLINIIFEGTYAINGVNMTAFMEIVAFLICLYAAGAIAGYIQQFIMAGVTQKNIP